MKIKVADQISFDVSDTIRNTRKRLFVLAIFV